VSVGMTSVAENNE